MMVRFILPNPCKMLCLSPRAAAFPEAVRGRGQLGPHTSQSYCMYKWKKTSCQHFPTRPLSGQLYNRTHFSPAGRSGVSGKTYTCSQVRGSNLNVF